MKNITFSHRNLHLFFLCLSLFCCSHVTTQSTLTAPPTNHIFELLNSEPGISIFLQQIIEKQDLSIAICIDPSSTLSLEDIDIPLEDVFEKTGSLFRPVRIDELYRNEKIATELLGNGKVHYRVYQVSEVEGHDSGNAFLYQQKKIIGEDNSDHSEIMTSQVYLKLIPLDEAAVEIEQSYRGFEMNCAVMEDVDLLASLNLESSFEFLKGGNSILLFISQSDPTNSLKDHEILSSFNNIRKEEVPIKSNVLRINKGTKDHNLLVLDLEETEPITSENTEISTYSTSSKSLIGSDIPVKTSTATLRNLRRLDEAAKKENISPESTLTTWIIVAIVVVVIFLIGVTLAVVAFIKRRRNNSSQQAAYHPQQQVNTANTVHNNRGITGEEATLATHSPPVVRPQQEFMNSEDDIEDPMQENFPCFNNPVRVDDVLRLFEIHFEGYKDNKGGEGTQCDICYDAKKTIMFGPCTHICACEPCAQEVMNVFGKCPLCRTKIEELTYVVKGAS